MIVLAFASAIDAQPVPNRELYITLDEEVCRAARAVSIVYNYDDRPLPAVELRRCYWKYSTPPFMANMPISLRLNGAGRTRCRHASQVTDLTFELQFSMPGTDETARDIRISGNKLRYVRDVPVKREGDVPCFELGQVPGTLIDVQFEIEDVRVQLFKEKKVGCGMLVNDIWAIAETKKGRSVHLDSADIAQAVERQGVKGKSCHTPAIVPLAIIQTILGKESGLTVEVK